MKRNLKKVTLVLLMVFIMLFTLSANVIAAIEVVGEPLRGDNIVLTTSSENENIDKVEIKRSDPVESFVFNYGDGHFTKNTEAGITTITITANTDDIVPEVEYEIEISEASVVKDTGTITLLPKVSYTTPNCTPTPTWKVGELASDLVITTNIPYADFLNVVYIDGVVVVETNYTPTENEEDHTLNITMDATYMNTYSVGTRTLGIMGKDGLAAFDFTVTQTYTIELETENPKVAEAIVFTTDIPNVSFGSITLDGVPVAIDNFDREADANGNAKITLKPEFTRTLDDKQYQVDMFDTDTKYGRMNVTLAPATYTVEISPENPTLDNAIIFTTNIPEGEFVSIKIGEETLDPSDYVESDTGDVEISVRKTYIETLQPAAYNFVITATNGTATGSFYLSAVTYTSTINPEAPKLGNAIQFTTNIPEGEFVSIKIGENTLDATNYTVSTEGPIVVTVNASYISGLDVPVTYDYVITGTHGAAIGSFFLTEVTYTATLSSENPKSGDAIIFTTNIPEGEFVSIKIGEETLDATDYTVSTEGPIVVTVSGDYTSDLAAPYTHNFVITAVNGKATGSFFLNGVTYTATIEPETPESGDAIEFTTNIPKGKFVSIKIGEETLDATDYTVSTEGPIVVTVDAEYTEDLDAPQLYNYVITATNGKVTDSFTLAGISYDVVISPLKPIAGDEIDFVTNIPEGKVTGIEIEEEELLPAEFSVEAVDGFDVVTISDYSYDLAIGEYDVIITATNGTATGILKIYPGEYTLVSRTPNIPELGESLTDLEFLTDIPYLKFASIEILDLDPLTADDYGISNVEGDTKVTLAKEYLNTLNQGTYGVKISATDGHINTEFYLKGLTYEMQDEPKNPNEDDETLSFTSPADYADFIEVRVDDVVVPDGQGYYKVDDGSTIVTLLKKFIDTLTPGKTYTLTIVSAKGSASSEFTLGRTKKSSSPKTTSKDKNPDTGDFMVEYATVALIVLGTAYVIVRKYNKK